MKYLALAVMLSFSHLSFASDSCYSEVEQVAYKAHGLSGGTTVLTSIEATDTFLKPGEERGYLQGEVWHSKSAIYDVQIYEVKISVSGVGFIFAYNVNPETCRVSSLVEVWMED